MHRSKDPKYLYVIRVVDNDAFYIGSNLEMSDFAQHVNSGVVLDDFYVISEKHLISPHHIVAVTQQTNKFDPGVQEDDIPF